MGRVIGCEKMSLFVTGIVSVGAKGMSLIVTGITSVGVKECHSL